MQSMRQFPEGIQFCYEWRSYQQRILDELDYHLRNQHLHLVAPPGSGKTVVGLEVMLRLNQPTIILAPTLTIKNQWESRFTELFLQEKEKPDWISMNIKAPAFVTITTYQALFSLYKTYEGEADEAIVEEEEGKKETFGQSEVKDIFEKIRALHFQTIVLDEAHHLRAAWWQTTMAFRDSLIDPTIVALTATPPYDVTVSEWERYEELCGPIDAEIYVPELVRENDLCAHQDYIYLSTPQREERKQLKKFHEDAEQFLNELLESEPILQAIKAHPWIIDSQTHTEIILKHPSYFSSMIIYLKHVENYIHKEAFKLLGLTRKQIPHFTLEWAEILMNDMLKDPFYDDEDDLLDKKTIKHELKRFGALERGVVYLQSTPTWDRNLVNSASKLHSIEKIAQLENRIMGDELRMVILTDYIRKEALTDTSNDESYTKKIGVVPIFQLLRTHLGNTFPLAILTGSFVVVPKHIEPFLVEEAERRNIKVTYRVLTEANDFFTVDINQQNRSHIVAMMTDLLAKGHLRIIVGTAALLGEGWDAPSVNTLIMASYVGSFMLSNQMRGRAIRVDPDVPEKTGAIWHLACVDTNQFFGGHDMRTLQRRFRSLVGLDVENDLIETGLQRMGDVMRLRYNRSSITKLNEATIERAKNRNQLQQRWENAVVDIDGEQQLQLRVPKEKRIRPYLFKNTIKALFYAAFQTFIVLFLNGIDGLSPKLVEDGWQFFLIGVLVFAFIATIPKLFKAVRLSIRYASPEKFLQDIGDILYETLYELDVVETKPEDVLILFHESEGHFACTIRGGKTYEKNVYLTALNQLLDPIDNPRYILTRQPRRWFGIKRKQDYLAIPDEIGRRRESADLFAKKWTEKIDKATAVYTRNPEGRTILIRARLQSLSAAFVEKSEQISVWK